VLTEPTWFKGFLSDMKDVRNKVASMPRRPAVLRKDFLIDEYMVYEARVHGADTVLLIVAVLEEPLLKSLIACSRELGMEPLVEVNNDEETKLALRCGAKVIGVNNRNLHNFSVDASTTETIMLNNAAELERLDCMLCALRWTPLPPFPSLTSPPIRPSRHALAKSHSEPSSGTPLRPSWG